MLAGVGTSLYIAPESLSRGRNDRSVKYSNKIDSSFKHISYRRTIAYRVFLSVLTRYHFLRTLSSFQDRHGANSGRLTLSHSHKSSHALLQVLRDLRKPEVILPPSWNATKLVRQTKIVQMCLVHDPELRVSPKDLENSDLLPARAGDDSIEATLRILCELRLKGVLTEMALTTLRSTIGNASRPEGHRDPLQRSDGRGQDSQRLLLRLLRRRRRAFV